MGTMKGNYMSHIARCGIARGSTVVAQVYGALTGDGGHILAVPLIAGDTEIDSF